MKPEAGGGGMKMNLISKARKPHSDKKTEAKETLEIGGKRETLVWTIVALNTSTILTGNMKLLIIDRDEIVTIERFLG